MMEAKIVSHARDVCKEMQAVLSASLVESVRSGMAQRSAEFDGQVVRIVDLKMQSEIKHLELLDK